MQTFNRHFALATALAGAICTSATLPALAADWQYIDPLTIGREAPAATLASDGKIYVTGGRTADETVLASVEVYDPLHEIWSYGTAMSYPRWHHMVASVGNLIYAIGGGDMSGAFDTMDVFDVTRGTWSPAPQRLNLPVA